VLDALIVVTLQTLFTLWVFTAMARMRVQIGPPRLRLPTTLHTAAA
jgi:hypothetical protein